MRLCFPLAFLLLAGCASAPKPTGHNVRVYTINNEEIDLKNLHLWEKKFQFASESFHPRWRGSLQQIELDFNDIAMAMKLNEDETEVLFRDGRTDVFQEFFEDEYNLRGWSPYGRFDINATLVRGIVFLDESGCPVGVKQCGIPPIAETMDSTDRFVTFEGDIVSGRLLNDTITIRAPYGKIAISRDLISEVRINRDQDEIKEMVQFANGDIISGYIEPARFEMEIAGGQVVTMGADELTRILFSRPVATEAEERR